MKGPHPCSNIKVIYTTFMFHTEGNQSNIYFFVVRKFRGMKMANLFFYDTIFLLRIFIVKRVMIIIYVLV